MTESDFLAALRKLPMHLGAGSLLDDAARLDRLVLTTDTLVEGVHFLPADPPGDVAWKLVAQNLSDLAAKGAAPEGVLFNYPLTALATPAQAGAQMGVSTDTGPRPAPGWNGGWDDRFLQGFAEALTSFAAPLLGGDTVSLPAGAPRVLTLTAIGRVGPHVPTRAGARAGDALYVTGTIGDAGAGLAIANGERDGPAELLARYHRPTPRLAEGKALAPLVHAMMDVSDGLLIDATRMAEASGLAVTIDLASVPLSPAFVALAGSDRAARLAAATAGDDYELLFAAPAGAALPVHATRIGAFAPGASLSLNDDGAPVPLPERLGWLHGLR